MSYFSVLIDTPSLGLVLDKSKTTPTIKSITKDGGLYTSLKKINKEVHIGSEITKINNKNVINMNYDDIVNYIKNIKERPLCIIIKENKQIRDSYISTNDSFKLTTKEMEKQSEIHTKKALKELVNIQKEYLNNKKHSSDSDSDIDLSIDLSEKVKINYNKLENKCHYLQLELNNTQVDYQDLKDKYKEHVNPLMSIDDVIGNMEFCIKKHDNNKTIQKLDSKQLSCKLNVFTIEFNEYKIECENYLKILKQKNVELCVNEYLKNKQLQFNSIKIKYNRKIFMKQVVEIIKNLFIFVIMIHVMITLYYQSFTLY